MPCEKCNGIGFVFIERNGISAAAPCECRPKKREEVRTPIDDDTLLEQTDLLFGALGFSPKSEKARDALAHDIGQMCGSIQALVWVVAMARKLHTKWDKCGLPGLRQILLKRYESQDGLTAAWSEAYPNQDEFDLLFEQTVPEYHLPELPPGSTPAQIEARREAATAGLPAGHSASADAECEEMVRRAVKPVSTPEDVRRRLADIAGLAPDKPFDRKKAEQELREILAEQARNQRAKQEGGSE